MHCNGQPETRDKTVLCRSQMIWWWLSDSEVTEGIVSDRGGTEPAIRILNEAASDSWRLLWLCHHLVTTAYINRSPVLSVFVDHGVARAGASYPFSTYTINALMGVVVFSWHPAEPSRSHLLSSGSLRNAIRGRSTKFSTTWPIWGRHSPLRLNRCALRKPEMTNTCID